MIVILVFLIVYQALCVQYTKIPQTGNPPDKFYVPGAVLDPEDSKILFFGMKNEASGTYENTLYTFDLVNLTWDIIQPESNFIPDPLAASYLYLRSDRILLSILGCSSQGYIGDIFAFNLTSRKWTTVSSSGILGRCNFAAASFEYNSQEYVGIFGGFTQLGVSSDLYLFNVWTYEFIEMPKNGHEVKPGVFSSMDFFNNQLYIFGVWQEDAFHYRFSQSEYLKIYNLDTQEWVLGDLIEEKLHVLGHHLIVIDESLYIFGGYFAYNSEIPENKKVFKYDLMSKTVSVVYEYSQQDSPTNMNSALKYENSIILSGGRTTSSTINEIKQIFVDDWEIKILSKDFQKPLARRGAAIFSFNSQICIFGGYTLTSNLNDMWCFDPSESEWSIMKSPKGEIPSARSNFAYTQYSDSGLYIFGGKSSDLNNDLYYYSFLSQHWAKIPLLGEIPIARYGSCLIQWIDKLIIIGGYTQSGVVGDVYIFDIKLSTFHLATWNGTEKIQSMNHVCEAYEISKNSVKIFVFGGETSFHNNGFFRYVIKVQFYDYKYTAYVELKRFAEDSKAVVSETSSVKYGNVALVFFGTSWSLFNNNYIFKIDQDTQKLEIIDNSLYVSGHASIHYNRSIYLFGGCFTSNILFLKDCYSNNFFKLDFEESENISLPCSPGLQPPYCTYCPRGSYLNSDFICQPCGPGKYSTVLSGTSQLSCLPCKFGTFADGETNHYCKSCPGDATCYIGSETPAYPKQESSIKSIQPQKYQSNYLELDQYFFISGLIFIVIIFLVLSFSEQLRTIVLNLDMFTSQHSNVLNKPVIYRKTLLGGIFTVIFVTFCTSSLPGSINSYVSDNIYEEKALVPLVTIDQTISSNFLIVKVNFEYYGGECVESNSCHSSISITDQYIKYTSRSISCEKKYKTCSIEIFYTDSEVLNSASISVVSLEYESYCSKISVNVTSDSSIPNEISSVYSTLSPDSYTEVFKGISPSVFNMELTPSVFYSESLNWANELTGYHVAESGEITKGSTIDQDYILTVQSLQTTIGLSRSNIALVSKRKLKYTFFLFSSAVLGSVFGILGLISLALTYTEQMEEFIKKKIQSRKKFFYLKKNSALISNNFQYKKTTKDHASTTIPFNSLY